MIINALRGCWASLAAGSVAGPRAVCRVGGRGAVCRVGGRGAVCRVGGRGFALEYLGPDPVDRLVQDAAQVAQRVLADRLGMPGGGPQFPAELLGQPFQVAVGLRVGAAVLPGRARPAAPARPAGPLAPLPLAGAAMALVVPALPGTLPVPPCVVALPARSGTGLPSVARRVVGGPRLAGGLCPLIRGPRRVLLGPCGVLLGPCGVLLGSCGVLLGPCGVLLGLIGGFPRPRRLLLGRGLPRPRRRGPGPRLVGPGVPQVTAGIGAARGLVCPGMELARRPGQLLAQGPHGLPDVLGDLAGDVADRRRDLLFEFGEVVEAGVQFLPALSGDAVDLPAVGLVVRDQALFLEPGQPGIDRPW